VKVFDGFRLSAEGELTDAELSAAKKLAVDTRLEAYARGLTQHRKYIELENGGYATAVKAGDYLNVHVVPKHREGKAIYVELPLPDFLSGYLINQSGVKVDPTAEAAVRSVPELTDAVQASTRWTSMPATSTMPSMYSGHMQKLVQYLLGFGKPPAGPNKLAAALSSLRYDDASQIPPPDWQVEDAFLNGVNVTFSRGGSNGTHGLVKDAAGSWWILEISNSRGTHIMPLQFFNGTKSAKFIAAASGIDSEVAAVLSLFKGLPTAESLPSNTALFNAYKRAGIIKQLAPTGNNTALGQTPSLNALFSIWGWTFNESGTEAHQVGTRVGVSTSAPDIFQHWKLTWIIGARTNPVSAGNPLVAEVRAKIATATPPASSSADRYKRAVDSKVMYLSVSQLTEALTKTAQLAFNYVDAIEVSRVTAEATFTQLASGPRPYMGTSNGFGNLNNAEVWNSSVDGSAFIYHDSVNDLLEAPYAEWASTAPATATQTPIFVYHNGDALRVVWAVYDVMTYTVQGGSQNAAMNDYRGVSDSILGFGGGSQLMEVTATDTTLAGNVCRFSRIYVEGCPVGPSLAAGRVFSGISFRNDIVTRYLTGGLGLLSTSSIDGFGNQGFGRYYTHEEQRNWHSVSSRVPFARILIPGNIRNGALIGVGTRDDITYKWNYTYGRIGSSISGVLQHWYPSAAQPCGPSPAFPVVSSGGTGTPNSLYPAAADYNSIPVCAHVDLDGSATTHPYWPSGATLLDQNLSSAGNDYWRVYADIHGIAPATTPALLGTSSAALPVPTYNDVYTASAEHGSFSSAAMGKWVTFRSVNLPPYTAPIMKCKVTMSCFGAPKAVIDIGPDAQMGQYEVGTVDNNMRQHLVRFIGVVNE
jgi:hypothetical protein